ncbi:MAG: HNH endonuclease [Ardenticatenia bacterium]|nr:HNH endonuclease [Ardenticatenia bacterium]
MRRLLRFLPDIQPKDTVRSFSRDQRIVIWRNGGGLCKECGRSITLEQTHADHVVPHVRGGFTTVDNGQALCAVCNLKKGSAHP